MRAERTTISFFGLGAKGVSALLFSYLKAHPQVCTPAKEIGFFNQARLYARGLDWYEEQIGATNQKNKYRFGELSTTYLESAQVPALIARAYPDAKLVAIIDNPLNALRIEYIEARQGRRIAPSVSPTQFIKQNPNLLVRYCFGRHLTQYFSYYAHTNLLVMLADEVVATPLPAVTTMYQHLDLDLSFVPLSLRVEEEDDETKKPGWLTRSFRALKKKIKNTINQIRHSLEKPAQPVDIVRQTALRVPMSPELTKFLKDYYQKDVKILSNLLHRDLNAEWDI